MMHQGRQEGGPLPPPLSGQKGQVEGAPSPSEIPVRKDWSRRRSPGQGWI